jgi:hypothetical protein
MRTIVPEPPVVSSVTSMCQPSLSETTMEMKVDRVAGVHDERFVLRACRQHRVERGRARGMGF